jgi:NAD+ synthase (glutamine-hydrolysing)
MKRRISARSVRFCLSQINITVGDIGGNSARIISGIQNAAQKQCDMVVFPELAVTGYPPEDLLLKKGFARSSMEAVRRIAEQTGDITAVLGFVDSRKGRIYNSAAIIRNGKIIGVYDKANLPNYGVFDEKRYFEAGTKPLVVNVNGARIGISVCEDIWTACPVLEKIKGKMDFLVNISASPYHMEKWKERLSLLEKQAVHYRAGLLYCNIAGGQDELVFDGHSLVLDKRGSLIAQGWQFAEYDLIVDLDFRSRGQGPGARGKQEIKIPAYKLIPKIEEVYEALKLGTKDYVQKNGFSKVLIALSGGVDSALVAAIARDALGKENVNVIYMPSKFSSDESLIDAKKFCNNFGLNLKEIPIQETVDLYLRILAPYFEGLNPDKTEENLQARIRGNLIMAFSNKFNWLVLTTGNKSEMSTGYATLYGDMAGGFAVIKDVPKTLVYKLCEMRNEKAGFDIIPENILKKAPTAELKFNQKDRDTLPDYGLLDEIIEDYVGNDLTLSELKGRYDAATLKKVIRMIDLSEYKRRQAPPGVKITPKAFGRDRRMPITNKYRE